MVCKEADVGFYCRNYRYANGLMLGIQSSLLTALVVESSGLLFLSVDGFDILSSTALDFLE